MCGCELPDLQEPVVILQEEPNTTQSDGHNKQKGTNDIYDNVFELLPAIAQRLRLGAVRLAIRLYGGEAFLPCTLLIALRRCLGDLRTCVVGVKGLLPLTTG